MLGNDVVDFRLAKGQSNWKRPHYLSKIFSSTERELVNLAANPDLVVWLIWSMKEAAYKIVNRASGLRFYNPLAFTCSFKMEGPLATGKVKYKGETFWCTTQIFDNFLHTLAVEKGISFHQVGVIYAANRSDYVQHFNTEQEWLRLEKDKNMLPQLYNYTTKTHHITSLSHHGSKLYIVYLLNNKANWFSDV